MNWQVIEDMNAKESNCEPQDMKIWKSGVYAFALCSLARLQPRTSLGETKANETREIASYGFMWFCRLLGLVLAHARRAQALLCTCHWRIALTRECMPGMLQARFRRAFTKTKHRKYARPRARYFLGGKCPCEVSIAALCPVAL